jgi:hypothetical protein
MGFSTSSKNPYTYKRGGFVGLQPHKLPKAYALHRIRTAWSRVFARKNGNFMQQGVGIANPLLHL